MFIFVGVVRNDTFCDDDIFTSQRPSDVFRLLLSTGVSSELKMVTYFCEKCRVIRIIQLPYCEEAVTLEIWIHVNLIG